MNKDVFWIILLIIVGLFIYFRVRANFKKLKVPSVCLVTGGVKTGKSLLCVKLALKEWKKRYWKYRISTFFGKKHEIPLLYTNVSLSFGNLKKGKKHKYDEYIMNINLDYLLRNTRFNYGSVIYIQECSLLADNMDFNNKDRNVELSLFNKLIAHETRGGCVYYDTQSILDSHYSIKRVASTYLFIQKQYNFGLFHILYVRELVNTENGVNSFVDDVDTSTRKIFIPFWYHHKYDRYEYSYLTDDLKIENEQFEKSNELLSFNPLYREKAKKKGDVK